MFTTFKLGLLLGLSIIISIGAQNLFVIQQAMRNEYAYICAFTCVICDLILITLGVTGASALIIGVPVIKLALLVLGILFLVWYGAAAIKRGVNGEAVAQNVELLRNGQSAASSLSKIILLGLSFSLLNPQAILDTVVIIGSSANHYVAYAKYYFVAGAVAASLLWFIGLAAFAKYLSHKLMNKTFWQSLELVSGALMLVVAGSFLIQIVN